VQLLRETVRRQVLPERARHAIPSARISSLRIFARQCAIEKRDVTLASKISRRTGLLPVNGSRVTVYYSIDRSLAEVASGWQLASNCGSGQTNIHGKDARRGCPSLPSPLIKPSNCQTSDRAFKHLDRVAFRPFTCGNRRLRYSIFFFLFFSLIEKASAGKPRHYFTPPSNSTRIKRKPSFPPRDRARARSIGVASIRVSTCPNSPTESFRRNHCPNNSSNRTAGLKRGGGFMRFTLHNSRRTDN